MSQIFEALTIAHDRAVEKLVDRQVDADETITVAPERFVFTHQKIRNGLIVAFFVVGLTLLATNYAFKGNALVAKSQPIYGVAFESTVHPASEFGITADLSGTVSSISVKVGDKVQQGQSLLHMDGREAELALKQAGESCVRPKQTWRNLMHMRMRTRVWRNRKDENNTFLHGNFEIRRNGQRPRMTSH